MKKKIILIVIAVFLIFILNGKVTFANKNKAYEIQYNGLLWVGLDYYSIYKYNSTDMPIKWLSFKKICNK